MPTEAKLRLIVFGVGDLECAIDLDAVDEVLPFRPVADGGAAEADGVVEGRSGPLRFLDLRAHLGVVAAGPRPRPRVLRLRTAEGIGVLVDDVADVAEIPVRSIGRTPALLRRAGAAHVAAVATLPDGRIVSILSADVLAREMEQPRGDSASP